MSVRLVLRLPHVARPLRVGVPVVVAVLCFWMLARVLGDTDLGEAAQVLAAIPAFDWLSAAAATLISFWAVGRYDAVAHRHLNTGVKTRTAHKSGACAIANARPAACIIGMSFSQSPTATVSTGETP